MTIFTNLVDDNLRSLDQVDVNLKSDVIELKYLQRDFHHKGQL